MNLKILIDDSVGLPNCMAEHGFSCFIEDDEAKVLFDLGYSGLFIKNANLMKIDVRFVTHVCFSHGHDDHTHGLLKWIHEFGYDLLKFKPKMLAHRNAFIQKKAENEESGIGLDLDFIKTYFEVELANNPVLITNSLIFLGQIERTNNFENKIPVGKTYDDSRNLVDDYCLDDSALIYKSSDGIVLITGCSHSGICNIIQYAIKIAKQYWNETRIFSVLGGLHLLNPKRDLLEKTVNFLKSKDINTFYLGHCTDFESKAFMLNSGLNVKEIKVGCVFSF